MVTETAPLSRELTSWLFVPADSERKLTKAGSTNASALVLDLEDSVAVDRIHIARDAICEYLKDRRNRRGQQVWVRINALPHPLALADLAAVVGAAPDGIMLPKVASADDVVTLHHYLTALEVREGLVVGGIRVLAIAVETPRAIFALQSYECASATGRLAGLTWGAEDLAATLGAQSSRTEEGEFEFSFQLARTMCLMAAHAIGVCAIETISANFRDGEALMREVQAARRAGFHGKLAIHPDQVDAINAGFAPSDAEVSHARKVVQAFAETGESGGARSVDGQMVDRPHLVRAMRLLAGL